MKKQFKSDFEKASTWEYFVCRDYFELDESKRKEKNYIDWLKRRHLLQKDNRCSFTLIFKRPNDFGMKDSANRNLKIWVETLPSGKCWLITGKNRGTTFEFEDTVSFKEASEFLETIYARADQIKASSGINPWDVV